MTPARVHRVAWMRFAGLLTGVSLAALISCAPAEEHHEEPHTDASGPLQIELSPEAARAAGIVTAPATLEGFHPHIVASGVIRPVAHKSLGLRAAGGGRVVRVFADVGSPVAKGQALAILDSPDVAAAVTRLRGTESREAAARRAWERAEELLKLAAISRATTEMRQAEYDAASGETQAARQEVLRLGSLPSAGDPGLPAELTVVSPLEGMILSRALSPGQLVDRGDVLFEIADLSSVWAIVDLYERDLGQVEPQGEVEIHTDAHPGRVFPGRIEMVEPVLDDVARTVHLRVALDNRAGDLRPGMFVTMAVPVRGAAEPSTLAVPVDAVQRIGGMTTLFVEIEQGRYELRPVETGREAHGEIEILRGLGATERIVVGGAFVLKSEVLKSTIGGDEH